MDEAPLPCPLKAVGCASLPLEEPEPEVACEALPLPELETVMPKGVVLGPDGKPYVTAGLINAASN